VATSVESKFKVKVSPERAVSIPLVPPLTVKVSPWRTEPVPESAAVEKRLVWQPDSYPTGSSLSGRS